MNLHVTFTILAIGSALGAIICAIYGIDDRNPKSMVGAAAFVVACAIFSGLAAGRS